MVLWLSQGLNVLNSLMNLPPILNNTGMRGHFKKTTSQTHESNMKQTLFFFPMLPTPQQKQDHPFNLQQYKCPKSHGFRDPPDLENGSF